MALTEDAVHYLYQNTGLSNLRKPDAYHYLYENVDAAAAPVPGILLSVTPEVGSESDEVEIKGIGLGATQGAFTSKVRLNALEMAVVSWVNVAAVGSPSLDLETGDTTYEYQLVTVTVPPSATTGVIRVEIDDGL